MRLLHKNQNKLKVVLSDSAFISGLSKSQIDRMEKELTFSNPQYANVKKFSKWATTKVQPYLSYYENIEVLGKDIFRVPLGYFNAKLLGVPKNCIVDEREYTEIEYPEFVLSLRDTQEEAINAYLKDCDNISKIKSSIQLPTGKGKTILGIALASKLKARTLIVVHKVDLIDSWVEDIKKSFNNEASIGIIRGKSNKIGTHFTVATIQTLSRLKPRVLKALYETFGFVILDECHHVPSSTFSLVNNFKSRYRLGLSATPERNDGLTHVIKLYFGDFCYNYDRDNTNKEEDILPFKVYKREVPIYYNPVCTKRNGKYEVYNFDRKDNFNEKYDLQSGERRLSSLGFNQRPNVSYSSIDRSVLYHTKASSFIINDIMKEYNEGHSCLVLFKQVDVLLEYYRLLMLNNVDSDDIGLYYGGNTKCNEVKQQAESQRQFITLATYSKAAEGTNVQQWEVAFLVSSVNNGKDVEQAVGRVRRLKDNGRKLKTAIVYDYRYPNVYVLHNHGAVRDTRYRQMSNTKFSRGF